MSVRKGQIKWSLVIGAVVAIFILWFLLTWGGDVLFAGQRDIENLRSCGGFTGTLGGGEGKCFATSQCGGTTSSPGVAVTGERVLEPKPDKDGFYWQPLGRGFGCPDKEEDPSVEYSEGEGPFCCVQVPASKNPPDMRKLRAILAGQEDVQCGKAELVDARACVEIYRDAAEHQNIEAIDEEYVFEDSLGKPTGQASVSAIGKYTDPVLGEPCGRCVYSTTGEQCHLVEQQTQGCP